MFVLYGGIDESFRRRTGVFPSHLQVMKLNSKEDI